MILRGIAKRGMNSATALLAKPSYSQLLLYRSVMLNTQLASRSFTSSNGNNNNENNKDDQPAQPKSPGRSSLF
jgi:peptidoglycan hydrolase-like amidase